MSMDYTIKAIPTKYNGRQYRSRLEARWAAFFDVLGWAHEYEPFDLGSWSPDFLLRGPTGESCIVEVKPLLSFDEEEALKMERAPLSPDTTERNLLLLGVAPVAHSKAGVQIGWWSAIHEGCFLSWMQAFVSLAPN